MSASFKWADRRATSRGSCFFSKSTKCSPVSATFIARGSSLGVISNARVFTSGRRNLVRRDSEVREIPSPCGSGQALRLVREESLGVLVILHGQFYEGGSLSSAIHSPDTCARGWISLEQTCVGSGKSDSNRVSLLQ